MSIFLAPTVSPEYVARYAPALTALAGVLPDDYPHLVALLHAPAFDPDTEPTAGVELFPAQAGDTPGWWLLIQDPAVVPALIDGPDPDGPHWLVTKVTNRAATFTTVRAGDADAAAVAAAELLGQSFTLPATA